ncbi:MAG: aldose epimerase family protein [Gemmataceae bacterium]
MRNTLCTALTVILVSNVQAEVTGPKPFGKTPDGKAVELYTLKNKNGMEARLITYGATLTHLFVPDKAGKLADVVLGFDDLEGYLSDRNAHFGCTTGRVANRIGGAKFTLDGKEYKLEANNGPNHLHGGTKRALDKVIWKVRKGTTQLGDYVSFDYTSPDGEEGYPGKLECKVSYILTPDNRLIIQYEAMCNKPTPVNLTNHTYFNLAGQGAESCLEHELMLAADQYTPADKTLIPTGKIEAVKGTPLDFTKSKKIGADIAKLYDTQFLGYDHNFVLREREKDKPTLSARVREPSSGRVMEVLSTQPGIQLYTGNFLKGQKGKTGKTYAKRSAFCLETQHFPDSVNQPEFPSVILKPGALYEQITIFAFSTE